MRPTNHKDPEHAQIEADLAAFLAGGGEITECDSSWNVGHKTMGQIQKARFQVSANDHQRALPDKTIQAIRRANRQGHTKTRMATTFGVSVDVICGVVDGN